MKTGSQSRLALETQPSPLLQETNSAATLQIGEQCSLSFSLMGEMKSYTTTSQVYNELSERQEEVI